MKITLSNLSSSCFPYRILHSKSAHHMHALVTAVMFMHTRVVKDKHALCSHVVVLEKPNAMPVEQTTLNLLDNSHKSVEEWLAAS
jgi:hypothetical protein